MNEIKDEMTNQERIEKILSYLLCASERHIGEKAVQLCDVIALAITSPKTKNAAFRVLERAREDAWELAGPQALRWRDGGASAIVCEKRGAIACSLWALCSASEQLLANHGEQAASFIAMAARSMADFENASIFTRTGEYGHWIPRLSRELEMDLS